MQCEEMKNLFLNRPTGIKIGSAMLVTGIISYLKFRPIAILVSTVYVTWVYKTFYSHYTIHVPKELTNKCNEIFMNWKTLRHDRPNVFCGFITSILFLLAVVGHVLDGTYILLGCLIAGVLLTSKYEIKIIKENNDSTPSSGIDVDEFCPRLDEANIKILEQIGDHADDTGIYSTSTKTADGNESDSDNELLPPTTSVIPGPDEIDAAADDDDDVEHLLQETSMVLTKSSEYKRKHFSNTSSDSDSDDSITRGLDFKNIPVIATIEPHSTTSNLLSNIQNTLARNLIGNIVRSTATKSSQNVESEDEISDFEILDTEEFMK